MVYDTGIGTETKTESPGSPPRTQKKPGYLALVLVAIFLVTGAAIALTIRLGERRALAEETEVLAAPSVIVIQPRPEPPQQEVVLPSTSRRLPSLRFTRAPAAIWRTGTKTLAAGWKRDNCSPTLTLLKSIKNSCKRARPATRRKLSSLSRRPPPNAGRRSEKWMPLPSRKRTKGRAAMPRDRRCSPRPWRMSAGSNNSNLSSIFMRRLRESLSSGTRISAP